MFTFKGELEVQVFKEHSRKCLAFVKETRGVVENSDDCILHALPDVGTSTSLPTGLIEMDLSLRAL